MAERPNLKELNSMARFNAATNLFIKKLLNNNTPRDQQWIYLAPGGDKSFLQEIMTRPSVHLRRFNEMIRISKLLPKGNIADPLLELQVQWLYMSYHHLDQAKYVESGKVIKKETLETLMAYFQAIHNQKVSDGTLYQQLKESTKQANERRACDKDRSSDNCHSTSHRHED